MRKMISFKVENLSEKDQKMINEWADGQSNIQQSLTNIVRHIVGFTGNADVMDFDVQRRLHTILNSSPTVNNESSAPTPIPETKIETLSTDKTVSKIDPINKAQNLDWD